MYSGSFSSPPYEPYSCYWDGYEPPPYSSNWDTYEQLQVQRKIVEKFEALESQFCNRLYSLENQLSQAIDMITAQLAQEPLNLQNKSTTIEEFEQFRENVLNCLQTKSTPIDEFEKYRESNEEFYVEANEGEETPKKDEETPTEGSHIETTNFIDESICEENEKYQSLHELQRDEKAPPFGQIILTIGDVVIEVHKGKVTLTSGKEEDVIKPLKFSQNFSSFTSPYFDDVVETNIFSDLKMHDLLEKTVILQDPNIVVGGNQTKIPQPFEIHPPLGKRKNNVNHIVRKLRRCSPLDVKFALGEPPD